MSFEEPTASTQPDGQPERFLEAVAVPLVKHTEIQFAARHALGSMLTGIGSLDAATNALERDPRRWKKWFGWFAFAAVILAGWGHAGWQAWGVHQLNELSDFNLLLKGGQPASPDFTKITDYLNRDQQLILLGDPQAPAGFRWKSLVDRFPDHPGYYAQHAICQLSEKGILPEDFDATASRIDPDNGWFICLKAASVGKDSVERNSYSARKTSGEFTIKNQARLDEALQLIRKATAAPKFQTYTKELDQERASIPLRRRDELENVQVSMLLGLSSYGTALQTSRTAGCFAAESLRLATANQPDQLSGLIMDWEHYLRRLAGDETGHMIDSLVIRSLLTGGATNLKKSAETLNLGDEADRLKRITDWKEAETKRRKHSTGRSDPKGGSAGLSANESISIIEDVCPDWTPPPDEILKPGRRADHAVLGRATMLALSVILPLLAGFLALYRFRHGKLIRLLSFSLLRLFRGSDFAWIISLGLVLPLAWHLIVRHAPWGLLDKGVMADLQTVSGPQAVGLLFTILMATSLAARWRVMRRGAMLDLGLCRPWFTWLCLIVTAITMPLMRLWSENPGWDDKSLLIPLAIPAFWLLVMLTRGLFGSADDALGQALVARASGRSLLFGMALAVLMMGGHYAEERHWVARDPLIQNGAPLFPFENEVSRLMNKKNLELLDLLEVGK